MTNTNVDTASPEITGATDANPALVACSAPQRGVNDIAWVLLSRLVKLMWNRPTG